MDTVDRNASSPSAPKGAASLWLLLLCSLAAIAAAVTMSAALLARQRPAWLAVGAGLAVFPFLPFLWHGLAEAGTRNRATALLTGRSRLALRTLAVALMVLGISLGDLGPQQVSRNLRSLAARLGASRMTAPTVTPLPGAPATTSHGLESFIPADATLVAGLAGASAVEHLLAAYGGDTRDKLSALATCKIDLTNARILVAARGHETQMTVVRAPGIADERNLYCLVGIMGPERMHIRSDGKGESKTLQVSGFFSHALTFRLVDEATMVATDEAWLGTANQKLFAADGATVQGPLAPPLLRVDRTAPLWVASVEETAQGTWDLALGFRQDGNLLKLRGSATPPSGEGDRAEISLRVPLAFAHALPASAVAFGIRGAMAAIMAAGGGKSATAAPPSPPAPAANAP